MKQGRNGNVRIPAHDYFSMWLHLDSHLRLSHPKVCGLDWQSVDFKSQVEKKYEVVMCLNISLLFAAPIPTLVIFMKLLPFVINSLNAAHMYAHACVYRCYSQVRLKALPVNNIICF